MIRRRLVALALALALAWGGGACGAGAPAPEVQAAAIEAAGTVAARIAELVAAALKGPCVCDVPDEGGPP